VHVGGHVEDVVSIVLFSRAIRVCGDAIVEMHDSFGDGVRSSEICRLRGSSLETLCICSIFCIFIVVLS
jgi:hypothetical protein